MTISFQSSNLRHMGLPRSNSTLLLLILLSFYLLCHATGASSSLTPSTISDEHNSDDHDDRVPVAANRTSFPAGFLFGTASSAYQYEGAAGEGGKGASIWDTYTSRYPGKIADRSNGDVAIDEYHRYKEDVAIMKNMGLNAYRFSISWPRILPNGTVNGGVNKEGITYYNNLINELLANGIKPFVTLYHWDTPQILENEYGGFLSSKIVKDFVGYADVCFKYFGDRVQHWVTLNEPLASSLYAYGVGMLAPGRCSKWMNLNCTGGDSGTEPYVVGHNLLLAHATTVKLYREKYQLKPGSLRSIILQFTGFKYLTCYLPSIVLLFDRLDPIFRRFMDPLATGNYPRSMRSIVGKRLPKFSEEESKMLKGSFDFVGLNYYTTAYISNAPPSNPIFLSSTTDSQTNASAVKNGVPIGPKAGVFWQYIYPKGIRDVVLYTKRKYNNPVIYITENGMGDINNETLSLREALNDTLRVDFYRQHLAYLSSAIKEAAKVEGYFAWSLLDNFEWSMGYTVRFGINYVDYKNGLKRYPKQSAVWFQSFLKNY
ncbi:unnamed protein product [Linum tenue]|uniref:Uncharacterized protein n=1 Tax=Linum tenue TaxID=586396 RepID=A0AAV0MUR9_9ROSI|nr:unnamed protein product [Linum tenue]